MKKDFSYLVKGLYASLELDKRVVGVKFIKDKDKFESLNIKSPQKPMNYCGMIKAASKGHSLKGKSESFKCRSGPRTLGIDSTDIKNAHGENWAKLGLYNGQNLSKEVREKLRYNEEIVYGVLVQPIELFNKAPDIVIIVTKPYNCMRIVQGYSYNNGAPEGIDMIGNQAICLECSVTPYLNESINVSVLCIGTRHRSGWNDEDMAVGISGTKFESTVEGLIATINPMESNKNKKRIQENFKRSGLEEISIKYNYNYYNES